MDASPELMALYVKIATWGVGTVGFLGTVIATLFHSRLKRVEEHSITKDYFKEKLDEVDAQRAEFHRQNLEKLSEIQATLRSTHSMAIEIGKIQEQIKELQKRETHLSKNKHEVIDAYLPRAFDNLKAQVDKLESRFDRSMQR